jgi:hypothetical protein
MPGPPFAGRLRASIQCRTIESHDLSTLGRPVRRRQDRRFRRARDADLLSGPGRNPRRASENPWRDAVRGRDAWDAQRVALYRTIFPQMTGFLPAEEGAQLCFQFEAEIERLKAA